jgi:hypothetical protein
VPRLEPVTELLEDLASSRASDDPQLSSGARILRVVLAYEALERTSKGKSVALRLFQLRRADFDSATCDALLDVLGVSRPAESGPSTQMRIEQLRPGMITATEIHSAQGALLVPAGVEMSAGLIAKLVNFPSGYLPSQVAIRLPPTDQQCS